MGTVSYRLKQILLGRKFGEEPPIELVPHLPLRPVALTDEEMAWAKSVVEELKDNG